VVTRLAPSPAPAPAPTTYPYTGQGQDRRRRRRRGARARARLWRTEVTVCALGLVALTTALTAWPAPAPARPMPAGVSLVRSGLVMASPFDAPVADRTLMDDYAFNGSARPGVGYGAATAGGLHIGVRPHGGWAGWFAVTIHAAGAQMVWHTTMARPTAPVGGAVGEAVFAVQTASTQHSGAINYAVVAALSSRGKSTWQVGSAHGLVADADTHVLWESPLRADTPATEAVTVRTDGLRRLTVWLGSREVYTSDRLHLDAPSPFQAYLEVQGRGIGYVATFRNFWVADAAPVTVEGAPRGAHLALSVGATTVSAVADAQGIATLAVPPYAAVGTGTLRVTHGSRTQHFVDLHYAGGDILQLSSP